MEVPKPVEKKKEEEEEEKKKEMEKKKRENELRLRLQQAREKREEMKSQLYGSDGEERRNRPVKSLGDILEEKEGNFTIEEWVSWPLKEIKT